MDTILFLIDKLRFVFFGLALVVLVLQYKRNKKQPHELQEKTEEELKKTLQSEGKPLSDKQIEELGQDYIETMIFHHKQQLKRYIKYDMKDSWLDKFVYLVVAGLAGLAIYDLYIGDLVEFGLMLGFTGINIYTTSSYLESKWNLKVSIVLSKVHFENQFPNKLDQLTEVKKLHEKIEPVENEVISKLDIDGAYNESN